MKEIKYCCYPGLNGVWNFSRLGLAPPNQATHIEVFGPRNESFRKMKMSCHYISAQLEGIRDAEIGARLRLSSGGSSGLEEQLRTMEWAILKIRDEIRRRAQNPPG
jgi:hypothetical protein